MSLKRAALWAAPLLFVVALFYVPLGKIVQLGVSANWLQVYADPNVAASIWFTIWQAAVSTVLCLVLGTLGAYVLYRKSFAGQKIIRAIVTVPLVLPTIVVAIVFSAFRSEHKVYEAIGLGFFFENSVYWIIAAHVFINFSLVVRAVGGAWAGLTNQTEEAAELAGAGRVRIFFSITLPQLKGAVVSAAALVFLFCSTSFGIILVLGAGMVTSIETEIASAALQFLELDKAAALALLQTLLTVLAFAFAESIARSPVGIEQIDSRDAAPRLDRRDRPAVFITAIVVVALICVPLLLVFAKAFTVNGAFGFDNFANLAGRGNRDLLNISVLQATLNTLRNVAISATLSLGFGALVSFLLSRRSSTRAAKALQRVMNFAYLLPVGISSVVLGLGYLVTYGANWITVPLVQSLMALPLVIRLLYPALATIDAEQREAAALAGANTRQIFMRIEAGIIRNVVVTAIGFAMIASIGEFGAASLLAYGDQATLPTVLYLLISRPGDQNFGMAMAVCAILILLTFVLVFSVAAQKPRRRTAGA